MVIVAPAAIDGPENGEIPLTPTAIPQVSTSLQAREQETENPAAERSPQNGLLH